MNIREFRLPEWLEKAIAEVLQDRFAANLTDSVRLADSALRLSDFYTRTPGLPTPWHESWCQIAYLTYYLPLNYLRNQAILKEATRVGFFAGKHLQNMVDFGSGLGAGSLAMAEEASLLRLPQLHCEAAPTAVKLHQELLQAAGVKANAKWEPRLDQLPPKSLLLMSYSLAELKALPKFAQNAEALILVEPATREQGRNLLEIRAQLIEQGWQMWAPCTHQGACPLLTQSPQDWCHDRIHFQAPKWFLAMEAILPIKNKTLTFSYLVASRKPAPDLSAYARLTGDFLDEKGKARQLVCRGPEREFLAWMRKSIEPQVLPRGELIVWPEKFTKKANEIRLENVVDIALTGRQK